MGEGETQRKLRAHDIMSFLQGLTGQMTFIEETSFDTYKVETDAGSSFAFEIEDESEEAVAIAYFWHLHHVYSFEESLSLRKRIWRSLTSSAPPMDRRVREEKLARMNDFARLHRIPPPPPKETEDDAAL